MFQNIQKIKLEIPKIAEQQGKDFFYFGNFIPNLHSQVMFIGEMPTIPQNKKSYDSHTNFQVSDSDFRFMNILSKYGFGGSYLTDIVKTCAEARRPTKQEISAFFPILLKEIEAIKPRVLIAIGNSAYKELSNLKLELPVVKIMHPAGAARKPKTRWLILENQIKELRENLLSYSPTDLKN